MRNTRVGWVCGWLTVAVLIAEIALGSSFGGWLYKSKLTFSGYEGTETLKNFPALVVLSGDNIAGFDYADCLEGGADIRFTDSEDNEIPYEIESWNSDGESFLWVRVPELAIAEDCIYLYWGSTGAEAPTYSGEEGVWAGGYEAVWHMNESDPLDATGNNNDGTGKGGVPVVTAGVVGKALGFNSTSQDYVDCGNGLRMQKNDATLSIWYKTANSAASSVMGFLGKSRATSEQRYSMFIENGILYAMFHGSSSLLAKTAWSTAYYDNRWHQLVASYKRDGNLELYIDGESKGTISISAQANYDMNSSTLFFIGAYGNSAGTAPNAGFYYNGLMDEGRFMNVAVSADWVWAEYQNIAANDLFITYGVAEMQLMSVVGSGGIYIGNNSTATAVNGTDFGLALTNSAFVDRIFAITNSGDAAFTLTDTPPLSLVGGDGAFVIVAQPDKTAFYPGESSPFTLRFKPLEFGQHSAAVKIATDIDELPLFAFEVAGCGDSGAAMVLLGTNGVEIVAGSGAEISNGTDFGEWRIDAMSGVAHSFTITNTGTHALSVDDIYFSGSEGFKLFEPFAATSVAPGGAMTFGVLFESGIAVEHVADMVVVNNSPGTPHRFEVRGRATTPLLSFETQSYVDLGTAGKFNFENNKPLTVEGWVHYDDITGTQMIYSKNNGRKSTYSHMFGMRNEGTTLAAYTGEGGTPKTTWRDIEITPPLVTGRWYHLAFSFDGTNLYGYVNGVLQGSQPFSYNCYTAHNAKIGGYSDSVGTKGLIYDMRLWDYARSRSEIAAQALLPPNCRIPGGAVGMWRLDEGEGGTAGDGNVFNPVTGILKNNATWVDATLPVLYASGENLTIGAQSHPYGAPTPPYGVVEGLEQGSNFVCSVTAEPQYLAADGRCRGVCSGYLWYTNAACAPVAGSGNSFDYSHESSYPMSLLVWQWENQYEIEITAGVGGSVTTGTSWLAPDTTVTTTAVPDESARFLYWAGDVTGEQRYATTITVTSDVPKAVEARFTFESPVQYVAPTGSDGNDGLSWATAKRGINAAFDSLAESGVIYMAGGNYPLTQTISFEGRSDVKILGGYAGVSSDETPGARDSKKWPTELDGQAAQRVIYLTGSSRIEFEGLTIANGRVSTGFGGGVEVSASSGIIFSDCLIARNYGGTSASGGGIALRSGAVVTITNSMVRNNDIQLAATPARYGGGIYVASGTTLLLVDTIVAGNLLYAAYSRYGGGIYSEGNLTMKNCLIAGNSVSGSGDGVLIGGGTATIESSSIVDNGGQGLRRNSGTLNVINSIVYGNGNNLIGSANVSYCNIEGYAPNEVSGIIDVPPLFERDYYLAPESLCRSAGSGTAESRGLGDYTTQVDGTAAADAVVDLGYHHRGGYALEAADIYVSAAGDDSDGSSWAKAYHSVSRALDEARDGTHIYLAAEKFTVAGESFPLQIIDKLGVVLLGAAEAGSVIDATGSGQRVMDMGHSAGILLQDITLRGGQRGGCSGLEIIGGGGITLRRCKVIDNYSTSNNNGGGLSVSGITLSIYDSLITNNFVTGSTTIAYKGGGFFAAQGVSEIWHSVISGNRIVGGYAHRGGGLAFAGGNHYIGNSLIIGNRSTTSADGVYVESGTVIIENCTVVGNNREAIRNEGKLSITNSIIWGHAAKPALVGTMAVGWSCSEDDLTESGEGNICSDPLFVDAAGGDYTLLENSPCWNAGIDRPWMRGALDLAGNKRRQHDRVDMGAYERQPAPGTVLLLR